MLKLLTNKAPAAAYAAIPLFVLGIVFGANAAFADEGLDNSIGIRAKIGLHDDVHANVSASSTVRGELRNVSSAQMKIKDVVREKDEAEHQNASASTSHKSGPGRDGSRGQLIANFMTKLNADRITALTELKKDGRAFETRMTEWRHKIASTTEDFKIKLRNDKKVAVESALGGIINRFTTIADKLGGISTRLGAKIGSLQADEHLNMSASAKLLADADAKLEFAKNDIASAHTIIQADLSTTTSKTELKAAIKTAKDSLKVAYDAYKDVIKSIRVEAGARATTSASSL